MSDKTDSQLSTIKKNYPDLSFIQQKMINALIKKLGIVTAAAKEVGICRETHYLWMKNPQYKEAVESINEIAVDFVEGKLYQLINNGNPNATLFYMKTKGRHRGYIERQEIVHEGSQNIDIQFGKPIKEVKEVIDIDHKNIKDQDKSDSKTE